MGNRPDPRIVAFRSALESLIESLDATVRIARWETGVEPIPDPLRHSAEQLQDRLGSANRLASSKFVGAPAVVATSNAIKEAVRDLDTAFVAYRKRADGDHRPPWAPRPPTRSARAAPPRRGGARRPYLRVRARGPGPGPVGAGA